MEKRVFSEESVVQVTSSVLQKHIVSQEVWRSHPEMAFLSGAITKSSCFSSSYCQFLGQFSEPHICHCCRYFVNWILSMTRLRTQLTQSSTVSYSEFCNQFRIMGFQWCLHQIQVFCSAKNIFEIIFIVLAPVTCSGFWNFSHHFPYMGMLVILGDSWTSLVCLCLYIFVFVCVHLFNSLMKNTGTICILKYPWGAKCDLGVFVKLVRRLANRNLKNN